VSIGFHSSLCPTVRLMELTETVTSSKSTVLDFVVGLTTLKVLVLIINSKFMFYFTITAQSEGTTFKNQLQLMIDCVNLHRVMEAAWEMNPAQQYALGKRYLSDFFEVCSIFFVGTTSIFLLARH